MDVDLSSWLASSLVSMLESSSSLYLTIALRRLGLLEMLFMMLGVLFWSLVGVFCSGLKQSITEESGLLSEGVS